MIGTDGVIASLTGIAPEEADALVDARARLLLGHQFEPCSPDLLDRLDRSDPCDIASGEAGIGRGSDRLPEVGDSLEREVESLQRFRAQVIVPGHKRWPTQFDDLGRARPLALRVRGSELRPLLARSVAIVGARAATRYGVAMAEDLAAGLAARGWVVVSGGAFGIDAAAHRGALAVGGSTVIMSAGGVDQAVPVAHTDLFERVAENGCIVSEVPVGCPPRKSRFLVRNRLIAAGARIVIVVEAAQRSGALATARHGHRLHRLVAAIPGPATSTVSRGCHQLIRDQEAILCNSVDDIEELLPDPSGLAST